MTGTQKNLVFTYGTLKKGYLNEPLLEEQKFLGNAVILGTRFKLYEVNNYRYPFPALVEAEDGYPVYGELYAVGDKCLKLLDQLESVPSFYDRIEVDVLLTNGEQHKAIAYKFMQSVAKYEHVGPVWRSHELSRYRLMGHKLCTQEVDLEYDGRSLWNKKADQWATPTHINEEQLRSYCMPMRGKFGADPKGSEPWNSKFFESRDRKSSTVTTQITLQNVATGASSPPFTTRNDLAEWAAENEKMFGNITGSVYDWQTVFAKVSPLVEK